MSEAVMVLYGIGLGMLFIPVIHGGAKRLAYGYVDYYRLTLETLDPTYERPDGPELEQDGGEDEDDWSEA